MRKPCDLINLTRPRGDLCRGVANIPSKVSDSQRGLAVHVSFPVLLAPAELFVGPLR